MRPCFIVALAPFEKKLLADTASDYNLPPLEDLVEDKDEIVEIVKTLFDRWEPVIRVITSLGFLEEDVALPVFDRDTSIAWANVHQVFLNRLRTPYDRNLFRSEMAELENPGFLNMIQSAPDSEEFLDQLDVKWKDEDLHNWKIIGSMLKTLSQEMLCWTFFLSEESLENNFEIWTLVRMFRNRCQRPAGISRLLEFCRAHPDDRFVKAYSSTFEERIKLIESKIEKIQSRIQEIEETRQDTESPSREQPAKVFKNAPIDPMLMFPLDVHRPGRARVF